MRTRAIALLTGGALLAAGHPIAAQCPSETSPYGINAHAPQGADLPVLLNRVQTAGIGWIRVDFVWAWIEPAQDSFNWAPYDAIVAAADARGIHIFATIGHTPAWATAGVEGTGVPRSAADFYDVCFRAAQRYRDSIHYWGMWNEPNLSQFWAGTRSDYISLILNNGADAVHAADPQARACGPELAHLSSAKWDTWLADCINQSAGRLDVVTHHGYADNAAGITDKLDKAKVWPWDSLSVKQVLQNAGWFGKPFWLTETGWESASVGETAQAANYTALLNDWMTGQPSRSWVGKIFFYELNDSQAFSSISFGIVGRDPDYLPKPAYSAYQGFISAHPAAPGAPDRAAGLQPASGTTGADVNVDLSWQAARCATSYEVYFGAGSPATLRASQAGTTFDPGPLSRHTTYYWRVDSLNGSARTTGDVAWFTTASAPADFDADGDVDQSDFSFLQTCLTGRGVTYTPACGPADLDRDGDVDEMDVDSFRACMSGPAILTGC
jgi:hypothetical protein